MKTVIMAGGKGTRIASMNSERPKPMIEILGKPILEHQIEVLKKQGLIEIILVIGYLGMVIKEYFQDGAKFGVHISYIEEVSPLGTAGALYYLGNIITEDFLLLNGDIIFDVNIARFLNWHHGSKAEASILVHPNNHPYDSAIIQANSAGQVFRWNNKEDVRRYYSNRVNAGIHILSPVVFKYFNTLKSCDLDRDILRLIMDKGRLYAYYSTEYVKDMGTPERYYEVEHDIKVGKVRNKNLANKQRAIFLDRDGTINIYDGFITKPDQIQLVERASEAIELINKSGYLAIVITNQAVIARGDCTFEELEEIHNCIETKLGEGGSYLDDIYFCPHHPDSGFIGERAEYKKSCMCRKPNKGLFLQAAADYNIDLEKSYMIGDGIIDMEAAQNAGCHGILIKNLEEQKEMAKMGYYECRNSLYEAVCSILDNGE